MMVSCLNDVWCNFCPNQHLFVFTWVLQRCLFFQNLYCKDKRCFWLSHQLGRLVELPGPTRGAAETVLIGLNALPKASNWGLKTSVDLKAGFANSSNSLQVFVGLFWICFSQIDLDNFGLIHFMRTQVLACCQSFWVGQISECGSQKRPQHDLFACADCLRASNKGFIVFENRRTHETHVDISLIYDGANFLLNVCRWFRISDTSIWE